MIWLVLGILALIALAFATWPLWRRRKTDTGRRRLDVYRAQLLEIEAELADGLLTADAAAAARLEVERRLLRAAEPLRGPAPKTVDSSLILTAAILAVASAAALYVTLGAPTLHGRPYQTPGQERLQAGDAEPTLNQLVDSLLEHLAQNPDAMQGWEHLRRAAPALGREADWARALEQAIALRPDNLELRVQYLESLLVIGGGQITPAARLALAQAMALDGQTPALRYYQALALLQEGKAAEAEAIWEALLAEAPADAQWTGQLRRRIAEAERQQGKAPERDAAQAILDLPPEEQAAQIRAMVEGLAARLEAEPDDGAGWLRLARAYRVLGNAGKSDAAYRRALDLAHRAKDHDAAASIEAEMRGPS